MNVFVLSSFHSLTQVRAVSTTVAAPDSVSLHLSTKLPRSPILKNPLGEGKFIRAAAALVIGYAHTLQHSETCYLTRYLMERHITMTMICMYLISIVLNMIAFLISVSFMILICECNNEKSPTRF